jgi:outer membrane protein TolC
MNKIIALPLLMALTLMDFSLAAQARSLDLQSAIQQAQAQSPSYYRAINTAENRYWNYRQFRASLLPQLNLSGSLPNYSSAIDRVTLPDGTFDFPEREQLFLSGNLSLDQNVVLTGGRISLISSLQRTDVYRPDRRINYFSTPISISYFQPMFLYNSLKWENKIQPLAYEASRRAYSEDLENIAAETTRLYFDALVSRISMRIAEQNVKNNDTIYKISQGRYNLGKIAENELLQIELNLLNAENSLTNARLNYEVAAQELKRYLGIPSEEDLSLAIPSTIPKIEVSLDQALNEARKNRSAVLDFRRRRLEAEQSVAAARGNTNYNFNLSANFGLNRQADNYNTAYADPFAQQQNISIGINIPIIDWGQARSQVRRAEANRQLQEVNIAQDEINFEQEIFLQVMQFNAQYQRLQIAAKADTVAQKRYEVARQRYLTGKITITDINIAQSEKDRAKQSYLQELQRFWIAHYTLRRLCLYDFERDDVIFYETNFGS